MASSILSRCRHLAACALATLLALLLTAGPAWADAAAERAKARQLLEEAQKAYDLGRFERAHQLYARAYDLTPLPGFLFNMAQCERLRGRPEQAAFFYRRFLEKAPRAPNAGLAQELLAQVQAQVAEQKRRRAQEETAALKLTPSATHVPGPSAPAASPAEGEPVTTPAASLLHSPWLWAGVGLLAGAAGGAAVTWAVTR